MKRLIQWQVLINLFLGRLALSHLRLLGSLSVASYDLQGLRWKYSYPPPHGVFFFNSLLAIRITQIL
jgi:hypothetical protein